MSAFKKKLHSATLTNNCPTCYSTNSLELTFEQEFSETPFFQKANPQLKETLYCRTCNNQIYPVNWTEDIERVYDYHRKRALPQSRYVKVKPLFYVVVLLGVSLVSALVYFALAT